MLDCYFTLKENIYVLMQMYLCLKATCLWRRALLACMDMNRVLAPHLARRLGIEVTVAQGLMNRLEKEKFIKNPGKGKKQVIC